MRLIDADALFEDICDSINEMTKIGIMVDGEWLWAKLNDALENAPTIKTEPQWIPCKERFPEPEEDVLVKIDGYGCYIWNRTFNHGDNYFWEDESGFYHEKYEVIAWMPLPTYEEVNE